ncbi:MAG: CotH kinase family protein [Bacteroidales bacterium]|nr:CotH kinase family protein [Bacteroidales bacterium]
MKTIYFFIAGTWLLFVHNTIQSQIDIPFKSTWRYVKGKDATSLPANWHSVEYSDAAWSESAAPFRYTDGTGGTVLNDMKDNYSTIFLRKSFDAEAIANISRLYLKANYDDGFVLWLNGNEIARYNTPDVLAVNETAPVARESGTVSNFIVDISDVLLLKQNNVIAVQGFNAALSSSDFYLDLSFWAYPEIVLTDSVAVFFSHDAGFYNEPFDLTITASDDSYKIIFTVDGSSPVTSSTGVTVTHSAVIRVDPDLTTGRGRTPAFIVKASLQKEGYMPSLPQAKTYIFTEKVKTQTYPGGEWPSGNVNWQRIDYNMASDVVKDSRYASLIDDALLEIPSVSLTTDMKNLFGESTGIYVNADMQGKEWEKECSVELIYPDGSEGFQINAGVRIRGGSSRDGSNPKHSFRLFFDADYGTSKLEYPLFGSEGVSTFKNLDLRTEQNYSWSKDGGSDGDRNTFVREVFSRDCQRDEGQPYTRSRYYHLYLNGMYWGLYQSEERPEASYAESYFGDDNDDYDVIKVEPVGWPFYNTVTDGNMDSWIELYNLCEKGFAGNKDFFALQGKSENGAPLLNTRVLVNIDNLIDYMLMIFYTGNFDAPVSSWHNNDMPNNFFAIYNRKNLSMGYKFIAHDSEHSLFIENNYSDGIHENRVDIPDMYCDDEYSFQPQWLHYRLTENDEYRSLFRDKAYSHFSEGGVFSPSAAAARFQIRADQIDMAIIAESARWGDAHVSPSRTKDEDWLPEIEAMAGQYFPQRTGIVIEQMRDAGLYSDFEAPVVSRSGSVITREYHFTVAFSASIVNPNSSGDIYYTLDGTDPRQIGGAISATAYATGSSSEILIENSTILMARVKTGNDWSPLRHVSFYASVEDFSSLKVTELAYHPLELIVGADTISGKEFEFIELKNTGHTALNISGLRLDSAVSYTVPDNTLLPPGGFYVVASKPESFYRRYGMAASGNFSGQFDNGGEYVLLTDRTGKPILSFTYDDVLPWPEEADGTSSLVTIIPDPTGDPNDYTYWTVSENTYGSPFSDDGIYTSDVPAENDLHWLVYPNPVREVLNIACSEIVTIGSMSVGLYNQDGRMVYSREFTGNTATVDVISAGLMPGLYFLKTNVNGNAHVKKVILINQ